MFGSFEQVRDLWNKCTLMYGDLIAIYLSRKRKEKSCINSATSCNMVKMTTKSFNLGMKKIPNSEIKGACSCGTNAKLFRCIENITFQPITFLFSFHVCRVRVVESRAISFVTFCIWSSMFVHYEIQSPTFNGASDWTHEGLLKSWKRREKWGIWGNFP